MERLFKRMRVTTIPDSGPKRKLLDATERLVVEKGFDLVSVRDITGAVHANVAAVNYHFGSREGLMELVMSHVMEPLEEARMEALREASSVADILAGYVRALLNAAERVRMDSIFFMKLAGRIMVFPLSSMSRDLSEGRTNLSRAYLQALRIAGADAVNLEQSWSFFESGLAQSQIEWSGGADPEVQLEAWIGFALRGFTGTDALQPEANVLKMSDIDTTKNADPSETEAIEAIVSKDIIEIDPVPDVVVVPEARIEEVAEVKPDKPKPKKPKKSDDQAMLFDF